MTTDTWNTFLQWASVIMLALTFLVGAGALVVGRRISARQEQSIANAQRDSAQANERAAQAELALAQLKKAQAPRWLDESGFLESLRGRPTGIALVVYQPGDGEAFNLATQLSFALAAGGWTAFFPSAIRGDDTPVDVSHFSKAGQDEIRAMPPTMRMSGVAFGISVAGHMAKEPLLDVLRDAFNRAGLFAGGGNSDERLPLGTVRIVVGPKG